MTKQAKSALAAMLDKINEDMTPISGGAILSDVSTKEQVTKKVTNKHFGVYETNKKTETIFELDPSTIRNWEFHDRNPDDFGDLDGFATELKTIGQLQPCIIRSVGDNEYKYEIIVGERRWRAAKIAGILLKVIIKDLNDHDAALYQAIENSTRKDISEYSKGISYARLIEKKVVSQKDLQTILKLSQSSIRNLLSFSKIDKKIAKAIENFSNISAGTSYEVTKLQTKGEKYIEALIDLSEKIREGKIGHTKLSEIVENKVKNIDSTINKATPIVTKNGRHIFTWRRDSNGQKSITFPRSVRELINYDFIEKKLMEEIQTQLLKLDN